MAHALSQTRALMGKKHDSTFREARNVARASRSWQSLHFAIAMSPRAVQIAEAIHFRGTQKTHVDAALLQQAHHIEHLATLRRRAEVGRIAHSVEKFFGGSLADDPVFEETDSTRRMRSPRHKECQHRQPHS